MLKVAIEDLAKSAISQAEAELAEMHTVKDASTIYPDFKKLPALVIPYVDPWTDDFIQFERDGELLPFCRVRYYGDDGKAQGFVQKRKMRYTQPVDSGVHPYFPVVDGLDWQEVLNDPDVPLMITEGEKKALCACLSGIPCIGIGGVYNFAHDGELLPILDKVKWSGRQVYICYDSDAVTNPNVKAAEGRLATELSMKREADVYMVRLPDAPDGTKMGLDDFVHRYGDDKFFELVESAPQIRKIDKEVLRLNNYVAWIEKDGLVLDLTTDVFIKKDNFKSGSAYSSHKIEVPGKKAGESSIVSVAASWLTHPHARRYTKAVFRPGTNDKAIPLPGGGVGYNRFRGLEGEPGPVQPFFDLYYFLMSETDEFDEDLIWKTICYKVQNLEKNIGLGLMLLGKQGSGKTVFAEILADMVDPYSTVISTDALANPNNSWIETSLMVIMNEAEEYKMKDSMGALKRYVTDKRQPMSEKYRVSDTVNSYGFYTFNSNERNAGAFADDDRRMIILLCPDVHPDGEAFYGPIWEWKENGGPRHLLHFFQNYDLEGWKPPRHAPVTREKRAAYYASLTPVQKLADQIKSATENMVAMWINDAMTWATSEEVGTNSYQIALANNITSAMANIQVRPFYTPEELAMMFPSIASTLAFGRVKDSTPAGAIAQQLMQSGVRYLKCVDNYDGFRYKGFVRQFLVICDPDDWREPITQAEFDKYMKSFPTYKEYRAELRKKNSKRKR